VPRRQARTSPNRPRPGTWKTFWQAVRAKLFGERTLCDTCKYDYGDACRRPDRPNATRCSDYAGH